MKKILVAAAVALACVSTSALPAFAQCGGASWYAMSGSRTANGERMNPAAMTAAHKSLPFGTKLRVTDQSTGKTVVVRVNDRGPYVGGRIIDLSKAAATQLGIASRGHGKVCIAQI